MIIWMERKVCTRQGSVPSEEIIAKMIRWEVKSRIESTSYCKYYSKQGKMLSLGHFRFYRQVAVNSFILYCV